MKLPRAFRAWDIEGLPARLAQGLAAWGDPFLLERAGLRHYRPSPGPTSGAETAAIAAALARLDAARTPAPHAGPPLDAPAASVGWPL